MKKSAFFKTCGTVTIAGLWRTGQWHGPVRYVRGLLELLGGVVLTELTEVCVGGEEDGGEDDGLHDWVLVLGEGLQRSIGCHVTVPENCAV